MQKLRLMCVLAHPDDEALGMGGVLAKYAAEGVETFVVTATRGEYGWFGDPSDNPGPQALGKMRADELHEAAKVLGVKELVLLDYVDGQLDQADPAEAINLIAAQMRRLQPDVVLTFDPWGLTVIPITSPSASSPRRRLRGQPMHGLRRNTPRISFPSSTISSARRKNLIFTRKRWANS
ncbi:PIG-L family deacetylase [bacterium]|nr:PIG-L family deacetylase [bacterium]